MRTWKAILTAALLASMSAAAQQAADSQPSAQSPAPDATQTAQPQPVAPSTATQAPAALPAPPVPVTLVHGSDDDIVPLRMSQAFTAGRLVEIPGAGHFDLIDPQSPAWPRVLSVLAGTRFRSNP